MTAVLYPHDLRRIAALVCLVFTVTVGLIFVDNQAAYWLLVVALWFTLYLGAFEL